MSEAEKTRRRNEVFRRINGRSLARWIEASGPEESIYNLGKTNNENENTTNLPNTTLNVKQFSQQNGDIYCTQSIKTSENFLPKTGSVFGHPTSNVLGVESSSQSLYNAQKNSTFILFDLRSPNEYCEFRIRDSLSFHSRLINQDKFPSEIYGFKNRKDKWIIVYDEDDKHSEPWADLLVRKGFQNIMMLTGGIAKFCVRFPEMVEGTVPFEFLRMAEEEYPLRPVQTSNTKLIKKNKNLKSSLSITTNKTGCLKRSKLPKKDLLMRQHRINKEIERQRLSNPTMKSTKELSFKPSEYQIDKGKNGHYQKRTLNFKKKKLTSKIK